MLLLSFLVLLAIQAPQLQEAVLELVPEALQLILTLRNVRDKVFQCLTSVSSLHFEYSDA